VKPVTLIIIRRVIMKVDVSELIKKSVIIMPEIKVWTGQSKLSVSDFPASVQAALPPEDLARLGSKQLLPKDYLREPGVIRSRTWNSLVRVGTHFLGGFLVPGNLLKEAQDFLKKDKDDFDKAVRKILDGLPAAIEEWLSQTPPEWRSAISTAIPSAAEIGSRYSYDWYEYALNPDKCDNGSLPLGSVFADTFLKEIAALGKRQYDTIKVRSTVIGAKLQGLRLLINRLLGYRITVPAITPVIIALNDSMEEAMKTDSGLNELKTVLFTISDPATLDNFIKTGVLADHAAAPVTTPVTAPVTAPIQEKAPAPAAPTTRSELNKLIDELQRKHSTPLQEEAPDTASAQSELNRQIHELQSRLSPLVLDGTPAPVQEEAPVQAPVQEEAPAPAPVQEEAPAPVQAPVNNVVILGYDDEED
jgi:hypothetical protein